MFQVLTSIALTLLVLPLGAQAGLRQVGAIAFEKSVSGYQATALENDLKRLRTLPLTQGDNELVSKLKLSSLSNNTLVRWLEDRVRLGCVL